MTHVKHFRILIAFLLLVTLPTQLLADNRRQCGQSIIRAPSKFDLEKMTSRGRSTWLSFKQVARAAAGTKVMWWNIGKGTIAPKRLSANLSELIESDFRPDVLILGEYGENALSEEVRALLQQAYPYSVFIPYNSLTPDSGIMAFSVQPIREGAKQALRWVPAGLSKEEELAYRAKWGAGMDGLADAFYTRTLQEIVIETASGPLSIVPAHLAQPWRSIRTRSSNRALGIAATLNEMYLGRENPLMTQIKHLTEWIDSTSSARRIVIGDFNIPRGLLGVPTSGFHALSSSLRGFDLGSESTFPAPSSPSHGSYPPIQIDHIFGQGRVRATLGAVLPLAGSDHLPVFGAFK